MVESAAMIELFLLQRRSLSWHRLSRVFPSLPFHDNVCHNDIHLLFMTESTTMQYSLFCCNDTVSGAAVIEMMECGLEPGKNV